MIEDLVADFKLHGNSAYPPISQHFNKLRQNWFRHVSRYLKMDYDAFENEFEFVLYNSLLNFNIGYPNKFEHYFSSALRRKIAGLKRELMTGKGKLERKSVSLCLKKHDCEDKKPLHSLKLLEILDTIKHHIKDKVDRRIVLCKIQGFSIDEICEFLGITKTEYWNILYRMAKKTQLVNECHT